MLGWKEIVQDYIIKHSDRIQKTTRPLRERFKIEYFTYHRIDNAGKYTVLVDWPDWAPIFIAKTRSIQESQRTRSSTFFPTWVKHPNSPNSQPFRNERSSASSC